MINKHLSIYILLLLTLALPLLGAVRINEIMFDTAGAGADAEFIELYNEGPGSVNLKDWSLLVNGTPLAIIPEDPEAPVPPTFQDTLVLYAGQYLAVFVGSPVAPPASSYSLGFNDPALGAHGGEILLQDNHGDPHDYIAYGMAIANPPAPLNFPLSIRPLSWADGDGLAFIEQGGTNSDEAGQWINRRGSNVTPGAENTSQPAPTVSYGNITVPSSFPSYVNSCQEIVVPLNVSYSGETPLVDAKLSFTLPDGFLFSSVADGGVFDDATRTITWSLGNLSGDTSVSFGVSPNCLITSGRFLSENVALSFLRFSEQSPPPASLNATNSSPSFSIRKPAIEVKMSQYGTGNRAVISEISTMVEFAIEVTNTGAAPLVGYGAHLKLHLKDDLLFISFRKEGPNGPLVNYLDLNFIDNNFTGWTGGMAPGATNTYYVKALNVDCAPVELGSATIEVGWGCGDSEPGTQKCWTTVGTGASVLCPPTLTFEAPPGAPSVYMDCQDVTHHIVIHNPNGVPLRVTDLEVDLPKNTYWISSKVGTTNVGTYNQATKKLMFTAAELTGGTGEIAAHGTITIVLVMRPSCTANTDRRASGVFNYEFECPICGWLPGSVSKTGRGVPWLQPALAVTVQDPEDPTKTTVLAERGETVTFKVVVENNGLGDLDTHGKPAGEEGGWVELLHIGSGLTLQEVRDVTGGGTGTPVTWQLNEGRQRWQTGAMASRTTRTYMVDFLVEDCIDVSYEVGTYWTCAGTHPDDTCRLDGDSNGSVDILLRNPSLTLGVGSTSFVIDYCNGATVSIPVTNANEDVNGAARNVRIALMGLSAADFEITLAAGAPFEVSHTGNTATFSLVNGVDTDQDGQRDDMARGGSYNLNFSVKVKEQACSSSAGGLLVYQPYYEDSCNIPYTSGTQTITFSRTPQPGISFSKTGPSSVIVEVNQKNLVWNISFTYGGEPNAPFSYTLIDDYPDHIHNGQFSNFTVKSVTEGGVLLTPGTDYTDADGKITRHVTTTFDGNGHFGTNYVIVFDAPTLPCVGGHTYTNNATVQVHTPGDPIDCNGCPMPKTLSDSSPMVFITNPATPIDKHERYATYQNINANGLNNSAYTAAAEICTGIVFDEVVSFTEYAPASWQIDMNPGLHSIRFRDELTANLRARGGVKENLNVEVYYFNAPWEPTAPQGTNYGPTGAGLVTWNDITYDGTKVEIDLKGLNNIPTGDGVPAKPNDAGKLWIRYTLEPQVSSVGSAFDFGMMVIPGMDLCEQGPEMLYIAVAEIEVDRAIPTVSINNTLNPLSHHISRCEPLKLRFNMGVAEGQPFDIYDARLVVNLHGNYYYKDGSAVINLRDEGGSAFVNFEPVKDGDTLIWNLGDLRGLAGGGYVEIEVEKTCEETSTLVNASLFSNHHCSQIVDGNGPGAANGQDSAIAGITSFTDSASASYSPVLYSGRLETRFATQVVYYNDGYPYVLLHAINSGSGNLYNIRIPLELGSLVNGTASLTFLEAHVTGVSGQTSAVIDKVNPITPVEYGDGAGYAHGHRQVTLGIDQMGPSSIVTIRLRLRMVLCADLDVRIKRAYWSCTPGLGDICLADLDAPELNAFMQIKSGTARVDIVEHDPTPVVLDLCGSKVRMAIEVLNSGSVNVYEPIIRERLPEGLQIVPDSVKYSVNGGTLAPFPEASGAGLRYTDLTTTTTGIGSYQTIFWNFTDPNNDNSEADSLMPSSAFSNPVPDDPYFERHLVMKPGTRLRIEFEAELDGCNNVAAYQKSDKRGEATLLYDLPCHHDNRYDASGNSVSPPRLPIDDHTREITLIDPGEVNLQASFKGRNVTQGTEQSASQVNAEKDNLIEWELTLKSLGPGVVPNPTLDLFVPDVLSVDFATAPPVITSPTHIVFVDTNPTGVPQADPPGKIYTFEFRNTDPDMIANEHEYYFSATETVTITLLSKLSGCTVDQATLEAIVRWGCCPGLADITGESMASMPVKSRVDVPTIKIEEGDGSLITEFDSCLGAYTITLTSPSTNTNLSIWDLDLRLPLPDGWTYAPLNGDGTNFIYGGTGARPDADKLTAAEEEPVIENRVLRWASITNTNEGNNLPGNIPSDRARLFPKEQLKIVVYLRADETSGVNCDLENETTPTVPDFTQKVIANYKDSCGGILNSPKEAQVTIKPKNPKLEVELYPEPATHFISGTDTQVRWILRLKNTGDKVAKNIQLDLDFDTGYSSVTLVSGSPAPAQSGRNFDWTIGTIAELAPGAGLDWIFTADIETVNRDSLTVKAVVRGYCLDRDDSLSCPYSYQELEDFVSGATIGKTLDGTRLQAPAVSTDPAANVPNATAANVTVGTIIRNVIRVDIYEGGSTDIEIRDVLPSGLVFLEANLINSGGTQVANLTPTSTNNNIITFSHTSIPQFKGITGGRTGNGAIFVEIWSRVKDDTSVVTEGEVLTNTAQLTVIRGSRTFDHTTPDLDLDSDNTITILEPFIKDDASLTKTSVPVSLPSNHAGDPLNTAAQPAVDDPIAYTFTAKNTGTSPAYELEFTDLIPWQLGNPADLTGTYAIAVTITPDGGSARTLTSGIDYNTTWTAGTSPNPGTFKVNLLSTTNAILGINETIAIAYHGKIVAFSLGTFVDNSGEITGYSSLPGTGGILTTARGTNLTEQGDERSSYADTYRPLPEKRTYHKFVSELPVSGNIIAEITPLSDGSPPALRNDGTTRATIGEKVEYWLRLDLPAAIALSNFGVSLNVPDGLTVHSAKWDIVPFNDDFSGGTEKNLSFTELGSGVTQVRSTTGTGPDDFTEPFINTSTEPMHLLIKVFLSVDRSYTGGTAVLAGNVFTLPATFTWGDSSVVSLNPGPAFTIVEPKLENLVKTNAAESPASFAGTGNGYRNYEAVGPNPNNSGPVNNVNVVVPAQTVRYTLTFKNTGTSTAYEIDLTDTIPQGMRYVAGSATVSTANAQGVAIAFRTTPVAPASPSRDILFQLNHLERANTATIEYLLQVDSPAAAGRFLLNQTRLTNYRSLPGTVTYPTAARDVTTAGDPASYSALGPAVSYVGTAFPPISSKTVESEFSLPTGKLSDGSARGTIGEVMTYELLVDIPDDHILYDFRVLDLLPANLTVRSQNLVPEHITFAEVNSNGTSTTYNADSPQLSIDGNKVSLYLESDVQATTGVTNEIRLVIAVTIDDVAVNAAGVVKANTMTFSWNQIDENPGAPEGRSTVNSLVTPDPSATPNSVNFTIIEPLLASNTLTKVRSGHYLAGGGAATSPGTASYANHNPRGPVTHTSAQNPVPNVYQVRPTEIVEYTVTFTNTGTSRAYEILLTDHVPIGFTLLTDASNAPTITGGTTAGIAFINMPTLTGTPMTPVQPGGSGTPISFAVNWLDPGQKCEIKFRTRIEPGIAAGAYLQNEIVINDFGTTQDDAAVFPELERDTTSTAPYTAPDPKYEKVGTEYPVTSKTIQTELTPPAGKLSDGTSRATIGELVTYEILLDIKDDLKLFDLSFSDLLPDGLTAVSASYAIEGGTPVNMTITTPQANGREQITAPATMLQDVSAVTGHTNEVVFTITATVDQRFVSASGATDNGPFGVGGANGIVDAGDILSNNATFIWNQINDVSSASTQNAAPAPVSLTIQEPRVRATTDFKKVITQVLDSDGSTPVTTTRGHKGSVSNGGVPAISNGKTSYYKYPVGGGNPTRIDNVQVVLPDDYVEYQITITNSGTARAFDVKISDILPRDSAITYLSGTGVFDVGTSPYQSGTADSKLTVASSTVLSDGVNCTQLDFTIDMLAPNESAVILYRVRVDKELGAGNYIGPNVATLQDYGSLPEGIFAVQVGNLPANTTVHNQDNSLERDTASDPAYAKLGPIGEDIGVQYPEFNTRVYRRYDMDGRELTPPTLLTTTTTTTIRIGEILIYELETVLPRHTILFDGGTPGNALAFRHLLNYSYLLIPNTEVLNVGNIDLTTLLKEAPTTTTPPINLRQTSTWYFADIANAADTAQTATLRFQVEVSAKDHTGAPYFANQTTTYSQNGVSYLFWNTIDAVEKATFNSSSATNSGDHPFLLRNAISTDVVQPNLQLFKTSVPVPDSIVGVSNGVGDLIKYTLTMRNWSSTGAGTYLGQGTAYDAKIIDILPKDFAPAPPAAPPKLTAAVHSIGGNGVTGGVKRTLVFGQDYTYDYDFNNDTRTGTITFTAIRDAGNNSYDSRVDVNEALVINYEMNVNPNIGTQGSGAGQRVNYAMLQDYYSFPETINDDARKHYGPEGPRRVSLLTDTPAIVKSSVNANDGVTAGETIEYTIVAPTPIIRANLYDVQIYDIIPDGLKFGGNGTITGTGPGPVTLPLPDGEVVVNGGGGNVKITVSGRRVDVNIDKIDAEGGAHGQVTVTLSCLVNSVFHNQRSIPRLHEFANNASLLWYDDTADFPDRARYAVVSNNVSHFYDATGIIFEPSQTGTAQPGTIRTYRHVLRSFEDNDIKVPITFDSTQENWVWQLFVGDGNGNLIEGPYNSGYKVDLPAKGMVEVIMRVFVPTDITSMITDVLTVTATGDGNVCTITDVTVTTAERIAVFKDVKTNGDYKTRLQVEPKAGNAITQRIRFFNNGPENVKEVYIYDFIPNYSSYIANTAVNTVDYELQYSKDGGVNWIVGEPAANGEEVVEGIVPSVTNLRWYYKKNGGVLTPGDEHVITFQIRIK
jgi:uncharacterized repeat protein (TIGR01451 family)/fimbrial isopeptide formation D2 family protein